MNWHEELGDRIRVPELDSRSIHVWQVSTLKLGPALQGFKSLLTPDETARASRFRFERDRRSFSVCRALLRQLLAGYAHTDAASIRFSYGPNGKPELDHPHLSQLRFNLSHSGDVALLAFALGHDVGVDVELMRELDFVALARTSFSKDERTAVLASPAADCGPLFYRYWTCKEACIKADGRGLAVPLDGFSMATVAQQRQWLEAAALVPDALPAGMRAHILDAGHGYAAAVAAVGSDWAVQRIDLSSISDPNTPATPVTRSK